MAVEASTTLNNAHKMDETTRHLIKNNVLQIVMYNSVGVKLACHLKSAKAEDLL